MKKFAFIGAGSLQFTTTCFKDLLTYDAFQDCEIRLMGRTRERLDYMEKICNKIKDAMNCPDCKIITTTDRAEALKGANGVVCTITHASIDVWRHDIEIPKKYGVDINIGDTRSVSGIFRALRNIPVLLDICKDIETYCPNAVFINYTNPVAMLCNAMQKYTNVKVTGLCHSVQGTAAMLAEWLEIPAEEVNYVCKGVNHQAFYTRLEHNGEDLYPRLREYLESEENYNKEQVRNEMFLKLGYYMTESSGHNSEYNQWFRKRPDLIEKYCTHSTNWNPGEYALSLKLRLKRQENWREPYEEFLAKDVDTAKSHEYAANIFNACLGDGKPFVFNGNVLNHGSIPNLPYDCCVEVPVVADRNGFQTIIAGDLPEQLAIMINTTARIESLVVEAAMKKSKELVYQAVYMDPLTSAVCSLEEMKQMCDELFEVNQEFLGDYT